MDDFSPIVERGKLEEAPGFVARIMRRRALPAVDAGSELVLVNQAGKPVAHGEQLSAGEKIWATATSWIKVDVAEHTLELRVPFEDPGSRAGFVAILTIGARVANSAKVVSSGISSVKDALAPALAEAVASCAVTTKASPDSNPVDALNKSRRTALTTLRQSLRPNLVLPEWLASDVRSISVEFDEPTKHHYDDLVRRGREGELVDATAGVARKQTEHTLEMSKMWQQAMSDHLQDPVTSSITGVLFDPTPRNIKDAIDQASASNAVARQQAYDVLTSLIDNNYLHKTSELSDAMKEIRTALRIAEAREEPRSLEATMDKDRKAIDAEAHTVEEVHADTDAEQT
jgi:hypothetical protein